MSAGIVAYDARLTSHMSVGMRQYACELLARIPRVAPDVQLVPFGAGDNFDWQEQVEMPRWIRKRRPALVHFPSPYAPLAVPAPYVVTIHDLIDVHYPQWAKPKARWYNRVVVRRLARGARYVITDDPATRDDLMRFFGVAHERICVIPLGIDPQPVVPMPHPRRYAIYAGNRRPHKDLATLIEGWKRADPAIELDLALTGEADAALAAHARERGRILFLGDLAHNDVLRWISGASMLVHAALREGFGLPLLEAASLGTPVVVAEGAVPVPLRPVVRIFQTENADDLARAIEATLADQSRELSRRAREVAASLTWDRCAAATAEVYRRCL